MLVSCRHGWVHLLTAFYKNCSVDKSNCGLYKEIIAKSLIRFNIAYGFISSDPTQSRSHGSGWQIDQIFEIWQCAETLAWFPLQWRHNERDGVLNHRRLHCLLNCWFRRRSKNTSKLRVIGLCAENSPLIDEFPAQKASNAENVSIWWRHHESYERTLRTNLVARRSYDNTTYVDNKTTTLMHIESIKTTSMENVSTGVLEKIKNNI